MSDTMYENDMLFSKETQGTSTNPLQELGEEIGAHNRSHASIKDDEELIRRMIRIKRAGNSLVPINQLPTELLINIFHASVETSWTRYKDLQRIASVAWLWSTIVKRAPALWAVLDSEMPTELVSIVLKRAGEFPLTISMQEDQTCWSLDSGDEEFESELKNTTFLRMVLPKLGRWKEANLFFQGGQQDLLEGLERPAPLLTKCYLEATVPCRGPQVDLFQGQAPSLAEMTIEAIPVRWSSSIFQNLRSIWIWGITESGPTAAEVLQSILSSPRLEYFHLSGSILSPSPIHQDIPSVEIPHLKSLNLSSLSSASTQILLSRIRTPALYRLIVQPSRPDTNDGDHLPTFLSAFLLHFSSTISSCISRSNGLRVFVSATAGTISVSTPLDLDQNAGILINFHHQPIIPGLQLCLARLLGSSLPRCPPISLVLDEAVDHVPESQLLWIIDGEINNAVTDVEIRSSGGDSFLPFLCKAKYLRSAARWPLPKLKRLHLSEGAAVSGEMVGRLLRQRYAPDVRELANTLTPGTQSPLIVDTPDRLTFLEIEETFFSPFNYDDIVSSVGRGVLSGDVLEYYDY